MKATRIQTTPALTHTQSSSSGVNVDEQLNSIREKANNPHTRHEGFQTAITLANDSSIPSGKRYEACQIVFTHPDHTTDREKIDALAVLVNIATSGNHDVNNDMFHALCKNFFDGRHSYVDNPKTGHKDQIILIKHGETLFETMLHEMMGHKGIENAHMPKDKRLDLIETALLQNPAYKTQKHLKELRDTLRNAGSTTHATIAKSRNPGEELQVRYNACREILSSDGYSPAEKMATLSLLVDFATDAKYQHEVNNDMFYNLCKDFFNHSGPVDESDPMIGKMMNAMTGDKGIRNAHMNKEQRLDLIETARRQNISEDTEKMILNIRTELLG